MVQEDQLGSEALNASDPSLDSADSITLKVQTSKKSMVYTLAKVHV